MITNSKLTIYHKGRDEETRLEKWTRFNYEYVWTYVTSEGKKNDGYSNSSAIEIRIPYDDNNVDIANIGISDILVVGDIDKDIKTQTDLANYQTFNIVSIIEMRTGLNPHVYIKGA